MLTNVKIFPAADFSANAIGVIPLEPQISYPAGSLVGSWRFSRNLALALQNRVQAQWGDFTAFGTAPTVDALGLTTVALNPIIISGRSPQAPMTIICVVKQGAGEINQLAGGHVAAVAAEYALVRDGTGGWLALVRSTGHVITGSAALAADGGDRWEFLAVTFDAVANQITLYRPRTASVIVGANTTWPVIANAYKISSNAGAQTNGIKEALHAIYTRVLTSGEVNALYASAQASLAVAGIAI